MSQAAGIANIINEIYQPIDGMRISLSERDRLHIVDSTYTYGEINPDTFVEMLAVVQPQPGEVFYDLGAGAGKAVICAAMANDWGKCCGVEILPGLVKASQQALIEFEKSPTVQKLFPNRKFNIQFLQEDVLKVDLTDADVIFLHATTFGQPMWDNLKARLLDLKAGSRVIVNTKQLDNDSFEKIDEHSRLMGWGDSMAFTYKKVR
jgi:precorrin-6B methylase 2